MQLYGNDKPRLIKYAQFAKQILTAIGLTYK